jgi:non-ribosomal peptide synthetase component F
MPEIISLPTDRPRPAARTFRGGRQKMAIPTLLTNALKDLSRWESATLYMTLLAGFAALLGSYSGDEEVAIGSPVAGRNRVEVEPLIGFFLNTLVLRTDLSGDPRFRELIGRARETALEAYAHQDLPFEKLIEELKPARSLGHNPLFQVWFVLQNTPGDDARLAGAALEPVELPTTTTRHDLQLTLWESESGLLGHFDYSSDLFDRATIEGIVEDFQALLGRVAVRPEERLSGLREALAGTRKDRELRRQKEMERQSSQILKTSKRKALVG